MTAIRSFKLSTPDKEMMENRQAWLLSDTPTTIKFRIYSREAKKTYIVTIEKSTLETTCTCEYYTEWGGNQPGKSCWHMRKGMHSYLVRIQRGEVE